MARAVQRIRRLRKGRCVALLVLLLMLFMMFGQGFNRASATNDGQRELQAIYVASGDTLWDLVEQHYDFRGDIRNAVCEVKELNDLQGAQIQPGQILWIPAY